MICPNSTSISKHISQCSVLKELGIQFIVAETRSGSPCHACKTQWVEGKAPTQDSLTDAMRLVVQANGRIELPTITERAKSLASSLIQWAGNGFQNVPEDERKRRIAICESNACGLADLDSKRCLGCGCFFESKSSFALESCPAGYWGPENLGPEILNNVSTRCGSCGRK